MQQSTSFNLDSLDNEAMGGGGDMAIEWVEDGHWENKDYFEPEHSKPSAEGPKIWLPRCLVCQLKGKERVNNIYYFNNYSYIVR
jgi:hypothetical protein